MTANAAQSTSQDHATDSHRRWDRNDNSDKQLEPRERHERSRAPSPEDLYSYLENASNTITPLAKAALAQIESALQVARAPRTHVLHLEETIWEDGLYTWAFQGDGDLVFKVVQTFYKEDASSIVSTIIEYIDDVASKKTTQSYPEWKAQQTIDFLAAERSRRSKYEDSNKEG